jgi:hypothetical protein
LAVLHLFLCRIARSEPSGHDLRTASVVVLGLTSLIAPLVLTTHSLTAAFSDNDDTRHLSVDVMTSGAR